MPYIHPGNRDSDEPARDQGELNYDLTRVALRYVETQGGPSYATYAEVIAAFECAKLEFYRRVVAPYEDGKCAVNGDVYPVST